MSGDFSDRHPPRPRGRIPPRPVLRPEKILPIVDNGLAEPLNRGSQTSSSDKPAIPAGTGNAALDETMRIRRRSLDDISAERQGLGFRLNDIFKELRIARDKLRLAQEVLERLRANAPTPFIPVPSMESKSGKKQTIGRRAVPPLVDIILSKDNLDARDRHAAEVAKQERTVAEFEQRIRALESEKREIRAQVKDKVREEERLRLELRTNSRHR